MSLLPLTNLTNVWYSGFSVVDALGKEILSPKLSPKFDGGGGGVGFGISFGISFGVSLPFGSS